MSEHEDRMEQRLHEQDMAEQHSPTYLADVRRLKRAVECQLAGEHLDPVAIHYCRHCEEALGLEVPDA